MSDRLEVFYNKVDDDRYEAYLDVRTDPTKSRKKKTRAFTELEAYKVCMDERYRMGHAYDRYTDRYDKLVDGDPDPYELENLRRSARRTRAMLEALAEYIETRFDCDQMDAELRAEWEKRERELPANDDSGNWFWD
jgi:hypothetical protein